MLTLLCKTKNDIEVYVDLINSHVASHLKDNPNLLKLAKEALTNYTISSDKVRVETDLGRVIGQTNLVETSDKDEIIYALREGRDELMRFVKDRKPSDTQYITIDLIKTSIDTCILTTAYIGRATPFLPGQKDETPESKPFWNSHALIWGSQPVVTETITTECPW